MKRNNRGYTLVELMVVIAILAVLSAIALVSLSVLSSTGAQQCATKADALLSTCKINRMSRGGTIYIRLYLDGEGLVHGAYYEQEAPAAPEDTPAKDEVLSGRKVSVSFTSPDAADPVELADGVSLYVSFNRETGGLINFSSQADGTVADTTGKGIITVTGGGKSYTVTVDALTGSHVLNG